MRGISPEVARARATRRTKLHRPCTARVQPREHVLVVWGRSFELNYRGFFAPGGWSRRLFFASDFARARRARVYKFITRGIRRTCETSGGGLFRT